MNKKKLSMKQKAVIPVCCIMLMVLTSFSGCVTPGTDFDELKIVCTVTRDGSSYDIYTAIGAKSIQALGMTLDTQAIGDIKEQNIESYNSRLKSNFGWFGSLWERGSRGVHFNTVGDLELSLLDWGLPQLPDFENPLALNLTSDIIDGPFSLADLAVEVYTADLSSTFSGPGWIVTKVETTPSGENYGYVVYDGSGYQLVIISSTAREGKQKVIKASVGMYQLDSASLASVGNGWYDTTSSYAEVVAALAKNNTIGSHSYARPNLTHRQWQDFRRPPARTAACRGE